MAMSLQEQLRAKRAEAERWIREREAEVRRTAAQAEAKGRQIYAQAVKTGQQVAARTPSELRQLGVAAVQGRLPGAISGVIARSVTPGTKKPAPAPRSVGEANARRLGPYSSKPAAESNLKAALLQQTRAALSGAVDEASFGLADRVSAATQSVLNGTDYEAELAEERKQDAYDAENYALARGGGQAAGFVGSLFASGGAGAGIKLGAKALGGAKFLAKAAKAANSARRIEAMTPGGLNTIAAVGGGTGGIVGQAVSDAMRGEVSDVRDYAASALGGAAGGMMARIPRLGTGKFADGVHRVLARPTLVGATEGAVTSALQDGFAGRQMDLRGAAEAARGGAVGAQVGDVLGKYGMNAAPRKAKEWAGENLSIIKSIAGGDGSPWAKPIENFDEVLPEAIAYGETPKGVGKQRHLDLGRGRRTRADHITHKGLAVEAKMGAYADLTKAQRRARDLLMPLGRYRIDHWLPSDVGRATRVPIAGFSSHSYGDERPWEEEWG